VRVPFPKVYPGGNNGAFAPVDENDEDKSSQCQKTDSALQWLKCGIPCPLPFPMKSEDFTGTAVVVIIFIIASVGVGIATFFKVSGNSDEFFVAGRSLPVWILVCTLGSQCLDASSALGNLDLSYKYHFWDGAMLPLGLGTSLILVGLFLAKPLHEMRPLTLPDCFARVYGEAAEVVVSCVTIVSFIFLLAGNLVGTGKIVSFLFGMDEIIGVALATFLIWIYSAAGGLLSVAYTDVVQAAVDIE
jgi:Na+/proline symporter